MEDATSGAEAVVAVLARAAAAGSTAVATADVVRGLTAAGVPDPAAAVAAAVEQGSVLPGEETLALARWAMAEDALAEAAARLLATAVPLPLADGRDGLDAAQTRALERAGAEGLSVLTAGPGCGRTRVLQELVTRAGGARVVLTAPVEAAAARLGEECGAPSVPLDALLREHGEARPVEADLVVVDEAHLLDPEAAAALLEAVPDGAHLVLAGDPEQRGSGAPGRVLADLAESRVVPATALGRLQRKGPLPLLLAAVRTGELPAVDDPTREVVLVPAGTAAEAAHRAVQLVTDSLPRVLGLSPGDVLVVCPDPAVAAELTGRLPGTPVVDLVAAAGRSAEGAVVVLTPGGSGGLDRPGLLTALSRGRRHLSVVSALGPVLAAAVAGEPRVRRTGLVAALRGALPG